MNKFEAVLIINPEISSKILENELKKFSEIIKSNSGKILNSEDWGLRDLSYKIKAFKKAFYSFFQIEIEGNKIQEIKKNLTQNDNIVRHLFVKVDDHQELPTKLNNEKK